MSKKSLTQISIQDASSSEVRDFALEHCGIEFTENTDRTSMIKQVVEAQGWLQQDPEEAATHIEILIAREPGVTGDFPWRGGANGELFSVKRGEPCIIPMKYWQAIKSSQNRAGFTVVPLTDMLEDNPSEKRIPKTGAPITILRYITK